MASIQHSDIEKGRRLEWSSIVVGGLRRRGKIGRGKGSGRQ